MKKTVLGMLFTKALRDIRDSFKQFISIIFIIGIAVTLFVGLQANYVSIQNRVETMYNQGNIADFWLTYDLIDEDDNDANNIRNIFLPSVDLETEERLIVPSKVEAIVTNIVLEDSYPRINKPSTLYVTNPSDDSDFIEDPNVDLSAEDFFIVDKSTTELINKGRSKPITIGDSLSVSLDISSAKASIKEMLISLVDEVSKKYDPNHTFFSEEEIETIKVNIADYFAQSSTSTIDISSKITNFMSHPENIATGSNSSPIAILSRNGFNEALKEKILEILNNSYPEITKEEVDWLYSQFPEMDLNNQLLLKFDKDVDFDVAEEKVRTYFDNKNATQNDDGEETKNFGNLLYLMDKHNLPSNASIQNDISQAEALSYVFPIVFLLVAVLIAITTVSQLILKEKNIIGTFKGIGLSKTEIMLHYETTTLSLGLIGCILGCIVGPCLIPYLMDIKYQILYSVIPTSYVFPVLSALLMSFGILFMMGLITFIVLEKQLRKTPAESMLPENPNMKMKPKKFAPKLISFMSLKIALRNIRVYLTKSIMVIIGIMGCTALLVCGFGIEDTLNYGIDHDVSMYYNADISLVYSSNNPTLTENIENDSQISNSIEKVYGIIVINGTISSENSGRYSTAIYVADQVTYNDKILDCVFPNDTIMVCKRKASQLGIKENDSVNLTFGGITVSKTVSVVYEHFSMQSVFVHEEDPDFASYYGRDSAAFIRVKEDVSAARVDEIANYLEQNKQGLSYVITKERMINTIQGYITSVKEMTNTIKIFAVLLAVICLVNLALLNFKERTREIATLKVLGFSTPEIARSLIYEVLILTIIGTFIGLFLGLPMEYLVLSINQNDFVSFIYYVSMLTYGISAIISVGTAFLINFILSFSIRRVPMVESLKSVE